MTKIVSKIIHDSTGISFAEDTWGNLHSIPIESVETLPRIYQQSIVKDYIWPSISEFHSIPNSFDPGNYLTYTVPENQSYHISFIIAATNESKSEIGYLGLCVQSVLRVIVPFRGSIQYKLFSPIVVPPGIAIEIKCMPSNDKMNLGIIVGGYLTEPH